MKIILFFVRLILSIRYEVSLKWTENLKHDWPVLVLPNHEALVDPRIILSQLGKYMTLSPVASEKYYNKPILKQIMMIFGTVPIWEMWAWATAEDVKIVFDKVVSSMKAGKNILIYPSWQIYRQDFESIKWKQSVYNICRLIPENTKVLWVRQRWLWWSVWSMAWDNGETTFFKAYIKCIWYAFANLLFFVPKRQVNIEIEDITKEININKEKNLNDFNTFLEEFYNRDPKEELKFLRHYFYFDDVKDKKLPDIIEWSIEDLSSLKDYDISEIDEEIKNKIKDKISKMKWIKISSIWDNDNLILNLYFDSLDLAEAKSFVQANFSVASNPPITTLKTIADLYMMAVWKSDIEEELKPCDWGKIKWDSLLIDKFN